ncbi:hydroxymethylglutaryl-CoA reductase, degradative [Myxococcus sp. MISCRS1]|uniref:hydroxymethylglutaryl-CoA reductase, degradative n=1 Tax=Myxococcus TaxID=32 RepID=UPI001CC08AC1|nr:MULTISPECIES: hydroxymethylglutaryl-CoA reductase, degradative [unclassified Myxococcus]MBZ4401890.1 hydroxymethylglutaryl-CoA reductase, degradative [Myxococcus sp. AS-1-15]MCY1002507.1 hydroxymethylglutaryl-CoA reductase, degradative [Myxococcus sp. MISCRS1]
MTDEFLDTQGVRGDRSTQSVFAGFQRLSLEERRERVGVELGLDAEALSGLTGEQGPRMQTTLSAVESAVGLFSLPLGLGLHLKVNGRAYAVPMVVEEPSVITAASFAAKLVGEAGGFLAEADPSLMLGQIQVTRFGPPSFAMARVLEARTELLALANSLHPQLAEEGGGAREVEVRLLPSPEPGMDPLLVVHVHVDTRESQGAVVVDSMMETLAPRIEQLTGGKVYVRALTHLSAQCLARARCSIPERTLGDFGLSGTEVAEGVVQASRFAQADPYRAAAHNKGIMNGIDALALATGQDWRAIEAGAHAFAALRGRYGPLSVWRREAGNLVGELQLPLALGTVGGTLQSHPGVQSALTLLGRPNARELACIFVSVGLAQNLAALRELGAAGVQRGHMAVHARTVASSVGAPPEWVEAIAALLVQEGEVKPDRARQVLDRMRGGGEAASLAPPPPTGDLRRREDLE